MQYKTAVVVAFLAATELVAGHGAIVRAVGNAGGEGSAIGIDENTPRTGTNRNPFQRDATRFKGEASGSCGETIGAGTNDVDSGVRAVMSKTGGLPQVTAGGSVEMTLHQVNGDGAGPYTCMLDTTGTGSSWSPIRVTSNVPGRRGNSRARATDFPLRATIPAGTKCTGSIDGEDNICMVRCQNPARAGPFGGCVPVQMVDKAKASDKEDKEKSKSADKDKDDLEKRYVSTKVGANTVKAPPRVTELDQDPEFLAELRADGEEI